MFLVLVSCLARCWLFVVLLRGVIFWAHPNLRIQGRMPIFAKIIKIEVPRPRDYAHRVERKKLIQITGVKIAVIGVTPFSRPVALWRALGAARLPLN